MAVAYHWSPSTRRTSIRTRGLVIGAAPSVNGVEDDHRNPWISLAPTAAQAWWLSGGALEGGGFAVEHPVWDLWEADLTDIEGIWRRIEWHMSVLNSPGWALHKANEQ